MLLLVADLVGRARENSVLKGLLPICAFCKKIRDEAQQWQEIEVYVTRHSEADFSHGVCPECYAKHYAKYEKPPTSSH